MILINIQHKLSSHIKTFKEIPDHNILYQFIMFVKNDMNSNFLAKKIIAWFNENKEANKERPFGFRFRGKESANYLKGFQQLIELVSRQVSSQASINRLCQVFHQSLQLRKLVSFCVRIEDTNYEVKDMLAAGRKLFLSCALYETSISPSMWCFSVVAPDHCANTLEELNLGLGVFTMEGREQKHQQINKYSHNSTVQQRWPYIFRQEFIQLVYLRENGFDQTQYRKRSTTYMPGISDNKCKCSLVLRNGKCSICDSKYMLSIEDKISNFLYC